MSEPLAMTHPMYLYRSNPTQETLKKLLALGPLILSPKIDGYRCLGVPERNTETGRIRTNRAEGIVGLRSKSLRPFNNVRLPDLFNHPAMIGLDGELCAGAINDPLLLSKTTSVANSKDKALPPDIKWVVFDCWYAERDRLFLDRYNDAMSAVQRVIRAQPHMADHLLMLEQTEVTSLDGLGEYEESAVQAGFEGVCIRSAVSYYKQGRTTEKELNAFKLKRYADDEATLLDIEPAYENRNEAEVNELGRTKRSKAKEGLVAKTTAGRLKVTSEQFGEFYIGSGWNAETAQLLWDRRDQLVSQGAQVKFKYSPQGVQDKPLKPIFIQIRAKGF